MPTKRQYSIFISTNITTRLSATLKQFLSEFAARYNLLHHVYMSIPGRIPTCDLIGRLFSCSRRDIGGDEDAVLSFCWHFPNLNLQHITSEVADR
jgi:hypothetical protein